MRSISTLSLSTLIACGPLAPPLDAGSTSDETTTALPTTGQAPNPTTTSPPATTQDPTTTDTSLDSSTAAGSTAQGFIMAPDGGPSGPLQCDVLAQDCPPGQKCVPWAEGGSDWNAAKCVDVMGDAAPGEPCTAPGGGIDGIDDCAFGAFCWHVDKHNHGTCFAQCTGTLQALVCPPKFSCPIASDSVIALCYPDCDPFLQDCPGDDLCIPFDIHFLCTLDASGDAGKLNDPCEFANSCDKGLVCTATDTASSACQQGSQGCCQPFCKFPDSPCPNPDQECVQLFAPMMPIPEGYENVGVCAIPN